LTKGRIAAAYGRFSGIRQVAPVCTPLNTCFFGSIRVHNPNGTSASPSVRPFCTGHCRLSSGMPGHVLYPKNCPLAWGDLDPHLTHGSSDSPESTPQTAFRSVQPFLHRESLYFYGPHLPPSKLSLPMRIWTPSNTCFLGPIRVHNPNGISIGSAVFAQITVECHYTLQRADLPP